MYPSEPRPVTSKRLYVGTVLNCSVERYGDYYLQRKRLAGHVAGTIINENLH